jgi:hypothetical protein
VITADENAFPNNIVSLLEIRIALLDSDLAVVKRPLRNTDPNQAVGIFASNWVPNDDSKEMRGIAPMQPTLSSYRIAIQAFIKDMDEERGLNTHAVLSRMLRAMVYTDQPLRVALATLTASLGSATERSQRWGISQQRFFSNELGGEWLYLSILEMWLETETT